VAIFFTILKLPGFRFLIRCGMTGIFDSWPLTLTSPYR